MNPKSIERVIYGFSCKDPTHFHKSLEVAQRCIDKPAPVPQRRWTEEMLADVLDRHRAGDTFASIGIAYGITRARARDVFCRAERAEKFGLLRREAVKP